MDGLISDLKRQAVRPEQFSKLIGALDPSDKNREIAWLYGEYQHLLDRHQMHDIEGRFWAAAEFLRQMPPERWGTLANVQHLVIDGFTDFTRSQHEVLFRIVARSAKLEELTVTLPLEENTARRDLFEKPQHTLEQLQARYPKLIVRRQPRPTADAWPAVAHLERNLFCNPREVKPALNTDGIEIIAAAGQKAEIEVIARRIKSLLILGDEAVPLADAHGSNAVRMPTPSRGHGIQSADPRHPNPLVQADRESGTLTPALSQGERELSTAGMPR